MKKLFIFALILYISLFGQNNQYLIVSWEMPTTTSLIQGFKVYQFSSISDTLNPLDSVMVSYDVLEAFYPNLQVDQSYFFRVIAYNDSMRSPFSDPLQGYILNRTDAESHIQVSVTDYSAIISWDELDPAQNVVISPVTGKIKFSTDSLGLLNGNVGTYTSSVSPTSGTYTITINNLQSDTRYYYFIIENDNTGNVMTTDVLSFKTSQFVQPDQNEPNDDFASATPLNIPADENAYIAPAGDVDYYRIQVPDSVDSLIVLLTPPVNANFDMGIRLFNEIQQLLVDQDISGVNGGEFFVYENPQQGVYYLLVEEGTGSSSTTSTYNLQVQVSYIASDTGGVINPDLYEPNDTFQEATTFLPDSNYFGYIFQKGDLDYFRFNFNGQRVSFTVANAPFDLTATVYDNQQNQVQSFQTGVNGTVQELDVQSGYFLELKATNANDESNTSPYSISYSIISDSTPVVNPEQPVFAGPNPFVEGKTSDTGYHFRNVVPQMTIEVYTLSLEKVWEYRITASDGSEVVWDLKNLGGQHIASGVYLVIVRDPDGKVVEQTKLVYIR